MYRRRWLVLFSWILLSFPLSTSAQASKPPTSQPSSLETVDLSKSKRSDTWDQPYLLGAYAGTWCLLLLYLVFFRRRFQHTQHQIQQLERRIIELEENRDD